MSRRKAPVEVQSPTTPASEASHTPIPLHHLSREFGCLVRSWPERDCQVALLESPDKIHRHIAVPLDLDLTGYIGLDIGLTRVDEKYHIRKAQAKAI